MQAFANVSNLELVDFDNQGTKPPKGFSIRDWLEFKRDVKIELVQRMKKANAKDTHDLIFKTEAPLQ